MILKSKNGINEPSQPRLENENKKKIDLTLEAQIDELGEIILNHLLREQNEAKEIYNFTKDAFAG